MSDASSAPAMVEEIRRSYLEAVCSGRRHRAFEAVDRARAAGLDLRTLYLGVFQPTLREVGQLWQENRLTVAEEHLATAITQSAMLRFYGELDQPAAAGRLLLAACVGTERHDIGLRMLCDFMDLEGWETLYLGASVPVESLVAMVQDRRPDAVALSATIAPHLPQLRRAVAALREAAGAAQPFVVVGGRPFLEDPGLVETVGADLGASDAAEAAARLRERFP